MKKAAFILILFISSFRNYALNDTLNVYFLENYPYSYTEKNEIKGIEIDILKEYINWAWMNEGIKLNVVYKAFNDFDQFYKAVKSGRSNIVGLGSVTINEERLKDVTFSPPYLKNVSIMISNGKVQTLKNKNDISKAFSDQAAITLKNSVYEKYLIEIKKHHLPNLKINYTESEFSSIEAVANNEKVFAYCDILSYWTYVKSNKDKFIKIQKPFTVNRENLGLIMPKNSIHDAAISEFFESGFGFIATKTYHHILETYLSYEVIESVEIN